MKRRPVIVAVDVNPRWNYGITYLECLRSANSPDKGHCVIHQRINDLLCESAPSTYSLDQMLPVHGVITIDLENIQLVKWSHFRGHPLLLCGIYGDACVAEAGCWLKDHGYNVTMIDDACLWGYDYQECLDTVQDVQDLKHIRMAELFPQLVEAHPDIWDGTIPQV
jgi:hypothetical protein